MRSRVALLTMAVGLVVSSCVGGGESTEDARVDGSTASSATSSSTAPTTTAAPTTVAEEQTEVVTERELEIGRYNRESMTIDLYVPADPSDAPIVIEPPFPYELAEAGAIVVGNLEGVGDPPDTDDQGVGYLVDHGQHIRAQAEATACAIWFARARASEFGNDDPLVVVAGLSQPGGVAAHVALFGATLEESWDEFAATGGGPPRQVECMVADGSTHVNALVDTAGTYDLYIPVIEGLYGRTYQLERDPELQQFLASAVGANPELVVRLFHDPADPAIPMTVSTDFEAALSAAGYDVRLISFAGGHNFPPKEISLKVFAEVLGLVESGS